MTDQYNQFQIYKANFSTVLIYVVQIIYWSFVHRNFANGRDA